MLSLLWSCCSSLLYCCVHACVYCSKFNSVVKTEKHEKLSAVFQCWFLDDLSHNTPIKFDFRHCSYLQTMRFHPCVILFILSPSFGSFFYHIFLRLSRLKTTFHNLWPGIQLHPKLTYDNKYDWSIVIYFAMNLYRHLWLAYDEVIH